MKQEQSHFLSQIQGKVINLNEEAAFDRYFRELFPALCTFAVRFLPSHQDPADVVQDCFLKLWEKGAFQHEPSYTRSLLYVSVRNACIDVTRRDNVRQKRIADYQYLANQWGDEEISEIIRAETLRQLYLAIKELPKNSKDILQKRFYERWSISEIAALTGLHYDTVRKKGLRVIKILRRKIQHPK